jgi:hypothetical protein
MTMVIVMQRIVHVSIEGYRYFSLFSFVRYLFFSSEINNFVLSFLYLFSSDLCWNELDGGIFPYPTDDIDENIHCHGFAWADDGSAPGDVNTKAKWNSLFFVSMYDHMCILVDTSMH